ncbi:thioesterase II family protein [Streptomyces sp. NPDC003042]
MRATEARTPGTDWVSARYTVGHPRMKLICLPHAGGGAGSFAAWRPYVPEGIELAPVELPGRGSRIGEPVPQALEPLVEELLDGLRPELTMPYALFGHSFGAVLAYELTRRIEREDGLRAPSVLVASGSRAPHLPLGRTGIADGDDEQLIAWMWRNGGLPAELLEFPDFLTDLLLPVRSDLMLAERYLLPEPAAVGCPLFAFAGAQDDVSTLAQVEAWAPYTSAAYRMRVLPGGHSFPQSRPEAALTAVVEALAEVGAFHAFGGEGHRLG